MRLPFSYWYFITCSFILFGNQTREYRFLWLLRTYGMGFADCQCVLWFRWFWIYIDVVVTFHRQMCIWLFTLAVDMEKQKPFSSSKVGIRFVCCQNWIRMWLEWVANSTECFYVPLRSDHAKCSLQCLQFLNLDLFTRKSTTTITTKTTAAAAQTPLSTAHLNPIVRNSGPYSKYFK